MSRLYIDGCSFTYGQGLPREQSLGALFHTRGQYQVTDHSRPGKSNLAIAFDTYANAAEHDVFVLGFTYSARFGIQYQDQNIDFYPGWSGRGFDLDNQDLDLAQREVYRFFYTVFDRPYCDQLSDMLIDGVGHFLQSQGKTVVVFSWERRNTKMPVLYPYIPPQLRLADGHLNVEGVLKMYDYIGCQIDAKQR